jgi:hypothetical protein
VGTAERRLVANYLAKYATKSIDDDGVLDRQLRHGDLSALPVSDHLRRLVETAWALGGRPELGELRLRAWAHTLGYRGHWLTKSRAWSTTFGALREARHRWRTEHSGGRTDDGQVVTIGDWRYGGSGHLSAGDAWLAASAGAQQRRARRIAWEEQTTTADTAQEVVIDDGQAPADRT